MLALTATGGDQDDREQVAALAEQVQQVTGGTVELAMSASATPAPRSPTPHNNTA